MFFYRRWGGVSQGVAGHREGRCSYIYRQCGRFLASKSNTLGFLRRSRVENQRGGKKLKPSLKIDPKHRKDTN